MFLIAHLECVDEIFFGFNHVWNTHDLGDGTRWYDETTQADLINKERHNRNSLVRVEHGKSDKYVTIMLVQVITNHMKLKCKYEDFYWLGLGLRQSLFDKNKYKYFVGFT